MGLDLHEKPFDEATLTKLLLFEGYLKEWLPVFVEQDCPKIYIADFFAGPGKDKNGKLGSPLRIIENIFLYKERILEKGIKIEVIFNEFDTEKYNELKNNIAAVRDKLFYSPKIYNKDFKELFFELKDNFDENPALLFLDQNGIKQVTKDILTELANYERTDFLFFISSSFFVRFSEDPSFKLYFPEFKKEELRETNYNSIHRKVLEHYKKITKPISSIRLHPFSIRKAKQIYGLIFGTHHIRGADKFLRLAWKINPENGEANFDIDDDRNKREQMALFPEYRRKTKLEEFEDDLSAFIAQKKVLSNKEIFDYTIDNGFIQTHAIDVIRKLVKDTKVEKCFSGKGFYISYECCYREQPKEYRWVSK